MPEVRMVKVDVGAFSTTSGNIICTATTTTSLDIPKADLTDIVSAVVNRARDAGAKLGEFKVVINFS